MKPLDLLRVLHPPPMEDDPGWACYANQVWRAMEEAGEDPEGTCERGYQRALEELRLREFLGVWERR
jgi:hypothetical protein